MVMTSLSALLLASEATPVRRPHWIELPFALLPPAVPTPNLVLSTLVLHTTALASCSDGHLPHS